MFTKLFSLALLFATTVSFAQVLEGKSAIREPGASYKAYKVRAWMLSQQQRNEGGTPVDEAVAYEKSTLPAATAWESEAVMTERFKRLRDTRFLEEQDNPGFLRRSSWLYPDDGCFARAALAVRNLFQWSNPAPSKIFVFGDLVVNTKNSSSGQVSWWYHVAPLVEVGGEKYVLDPAIEPGQPLKLGEWLARMSPNPGSLEVAVCKSGSYTPYDPCGKETDGVESGAENDQMTYLRAEWNRLEQLGRNPEQELGDNPPWLH